jgi:hypothetical protein
VFTVLVWGWRVGGEVVEARLDRASGLESVFVGPRLASRAPSGASPEGHRIGRPGGELSASATQPAMLRVVIDSEALSARLLADDVEVPLTKAPSALALSLGRALPRAVVAHVRAIGATVAVAALALVVLVALRGRSSGDNAAQLPFDVAFRNGQELFTVHYPSAACARVEEGGRVRVRCGETAFMFDVTPRAIGDAIAPGREGADADLAEPGACNAKRTAADDGAVKLECFFSRYKRSYRFLAELPKSRVPRDEALVARVFSAVTVAGPDSVPYEIEGERRLQGAVDADNDLRAKAAIRAFDLELQERDAKKNRATRVPASRR